MTGRIRQGHKRRARKRHRPGRKPIEAVRQIDRIGRADEHRRRPRDKEQPQRDRPSQDRDVQIDSARLVVVDDIQRGRTHPADHPLSRELLPDRQAVLAGAQLDPVVPRSDGSQRERQKERQRDVPIGKIAPQGNRQSHGREDEHPAYGRRVAFGRVDFIESRGIAGDPFAKPALQPADRQRSKQDRQKERRETRQRRPRRDLGPVFRRGDELQILQQRPELRGGRGPIRRDANARHSRVAPPFGRMATTRSFQKSRDAGCVAGKPIGAA
jgi:hypothetical protein